jgi:hypothetical protein
VGFGFFKGWILGWVFSMKSFVVECSGHVLLQSGCKRKTNPIMSKGVRYLQHQRTPWTQVLLDPNQKIF